MMERVWSDILRRFGQEVTLRRGGTEVQVQALVQPCLERREEQERPGPLGLGRRDRFRYMGPAERPVDLDTLVVWKGREYRTRSAQLVGEGVCPHWWALLSPREEAEI